MGITASVSRKKSLISAFSSATSCGLRSDKILRFADVVAQVVKFQSVAAVSLIGEEANQFPVAAPHISAGQETVDVSASAVWKVGKQHRGAARRCRAKRGICETPSNFCPTCGFSSQASSSVGKEIGALKQRIAGGCRRDFFRPRHEQRHTRAAFVVAGLAATQRRVARHRNAGELRVIGGFFGDVVPAAVVAGENR